MQWREHVSLAGYTTFGIGGPARWFGRAETEADIVEAVSFAKELDLSLFVLGGGSNLLVSDDGFPGVVLHIALRGIVELENGKQSKQLIVRAAAGENWDEFVSYAVERGYAGIECLAGIPGTVGGTPVQNVGAYGQEVAETICLVRAFDREKETFVDMDRQACGFDYRQSVFNTTQRERYVVTRVDFTLKPGGSAAIRYADLKRRFDSWETPSLAETAAAVREIRRGKGMYLVPGDPDCASAGSFFKNPIVEAAALARIAAAAPAGTAIPQYPAQPGYVKLAAAWLVEEAGFHKGHTLGSVGISSRHTLALVNRGSGSAAEIVKLSEQIIWAVEQKFDVRLEREPVWVG